MSFPPVSFFWVAGNIASAAFLSCFCVIIASKARWKGLSSSTLIIAGSSILYQIHGWIAEYARNNEAGGSGLLNAVAGLYFAIRPLLPTFLSIALIIIFFLLSEKAIFKAPYLAAGISSCLSFLSAFPYFVLAMDIRTNIFFSIRGIVLKTLPASNVLPSFSAVGFLVATILSLTMKAEEATTSP